MTSHNTTPCLPQSKIETAEHLFDNWFEIELANCCKPCDKVVARSLYARRTPAAPIRRWDRLCTLSRTSPGAISQGATPVQVIRLARPTLMLG
jgi:hypothetical protein